MFWPLRTQGTDSKESGVRGGGGVAAQTERKSVRKKHAAIYSLIVGLTSI
jgi:hypothetical protein